MLRDGHQTGVHGNKHTTADCRVRARRPDSLQYVPLPPPRQWTPDQDVGDLMVTATYLCNGMSYFGLNMDTPFKWLYGKVGDASHFKAIGTRAFGHTMNVKKLGAETRGGMSCCFSKEKALPYRAWNPKIYTCMSYNIRFLR